MFYCISIYTSGQAFFRNFTSELSLIKYIYIETFKGVKMFKAIKEFFVGKPQPTTTDAKVDAVNAAPYKIEAPVVEVANVASTKPATAKRAPAVKKPAAPKAKAPVKKPLAKAGEKKQPAKKPPVKKTK